MTYTVISAATNIISIGNTGLRTKDPATEHIKILSALKDFRKIVPDGWEEEKEQKEFLKFIKENEIWDIKEGNKVPAQKDIRLKTSFLSDAGFTTEDRCITSAGEKLLNSSSSETTINKWLISNQSFIFFKQLLKFQQDNFKIQPLLSLIYCCLEFDNELPYEFLRTIWATASSREEVLEGIELYKSSDGNLKEYLLNRAKRSEQTKNVKNNLNIFLNRSSISDSKEFRDLIFNRHILPHGKGGTFLVDPSRRRQNKPYDLFFTLVAYWENKSKWDDEEKKNFILNNLKSKHKMLWTQARVGDFHEFLFDEASISKNKSNWEKIISFFENTDLMSSTNKEELLINFYLFSAFMNGVVNIKEYEDLNFRHLKLLDIFYLDYSTVKLKLQFKYLFEPVKDRLLGMKVSSNEKEYRNKLEDLQEEFPEIYDFLREPYSRIYERIVNDIPEVEKLGLQNYEHKEKLKKLKQLVEQSFTKEKLIVLFQLIDEGNVREISRKIQEEVNTAMTCSIPALFEYLLGIAFYWISNKSVKLEDVLDGGLDANLLPITHKPGGRADVMGIKSKSKHYIIEATLSEGVVQLKMEGEPVPRHLAKYIQDINKETICLFVARELDYNNLVVLRNYRYSKWYTTKKEFVGSMDILPLTIKNILFILKSNMSFDDFEKIADNLIASKQKDGKVWYYEEVVKKFQ